MEAVLQWGLEFIRSVQTIASPSLTVFMKIITAIGGEIMYMALLPVLFWCIDEKKGLHLCYILLISAWINMSLKFLFDQPRPFFEGYDPSVGMINERMGGLPSGHAQNILVVLFMLAFWIKKTWAYAGAALLCFLISFSRIYLGVHFPTDIIAGWIIGCFVLGGYLVLNGRIEAFLVRGGFRAGVIASAVVSFIMILYLPDKSLLMPGGILFGFGIGYCLNRRCIGFVSSKLFGRTGLKKCLTFAGRILFGVAGFLLILVAAKRLISGDSGNQKLYIFIILAIIGFWVTAAAPWVFVKLRLSEPCICKAEQKPGA